MARGFRYPWRMNQRKNGGWNINETLYLVQLSVSRRRKPIYGKGASPGLNLDKNLGHYGNDFKKTWKSSRLVFFILHLLSCPLNRGSKLPSRILSNEFQLLTSSIPQMWNCLHESTQCVFWNASYFYGVSTNKQILKLRGPFKVTLQQRLKRNSLQGRRW